MARRTPADPWPRPVPPRHTRPGLRLALCTLLLSLSAAAPAPAAITQLFPANRDVDASSTGWTHSASCLPLCVIGGSHSLVDGNPGGHLNSAFVSIVGSGSGYGTWRSASFSYAGGAPTGVAVTVDRRLLLGGVLPIDSQVAWRASIVDETSAATAVVFDERLTVSDVGYVTRQAAVEPGFVVAGHSYHVELRSSFSMAFGVLSGVGLDYDNIRLSTTVSQKPAVELWPAEGVSTSGATLTGQVDGKGLPTSARFEWGTTTAYGNQTPASDVSGLQALSAPLTGLTPGQTYHFRLLATNADGTTTSADGTVLASALHPPGVTLGEPSAVGKHGATLNGFVNPSGLATSVRFEYGPDTGYGTTTTLQDAGSGTAGQPVAAVLSGLTPGTYHYRLLATSVDGTSSSADATFTTAPLTPPAAETLPATNVGDTTVTLNASVDPHGVATGYHFEYGPDTGYGTATADQDAGAGEGPAIGDAALSGLPAATTVHYRVVATSADGTTAGADHTVTTAAVPLPDLTLGATTAIGKRGATLNGTVDPNGPDTAYHFEYGVTAAYGAQTGAQVVATGAGGPVLASLADLLPDTTYHVRLVAVNANGTSQTADGSFRTDALQTPVAFSGTATDVTHQQATLGGVVTPSGLPTSYRFEYGTDGAYAQITDPLDAGGSSTALPVQAALTDLQPDTVYRYRLRAENADGASVGEGTTFRTAPTPAAPVTPVAPDTRTAPVVSTGAATVTGRDSVLLGGRVRTGGAPTTWRVEVGTSAALGIPLGAHAVDGDGAIDITEPLRGLRPGVTVHYRLVAVNAKGADTGETRSVTLPAPPPAAEPPADSPSAAQLAATRCRDVRIARTTRTVLVDGRRLRLVIDVPRPVTAGDPLLARLAGPRGAARRVRLAIGTAPVPVTRTATDWRARIYPADLPSAARQTLTLTLTPRRGRARVVRVPLTLRACRALLRADARFSVGLSEVRLRAFVVSPMQRARFTLARGLRLPAAGHPLGRLRVWTARNTVASWRLVARGDGQASLAGAISPAPRVLVRGGVATVDGLPAATRRVELNLAISRRQFRARLVGAKARPLSFSALLATASEPRGVRARALLRPLVSATPGGR